VKHREEQGTSLEMSYMGRHRERRTSAGPFEIPPTPTGDQDPKERGSIVAPAPKRILTVENPPKQQKKKKKKKMDESEVV